MNRLESRTVWVGFLLVGLVIAVTAASYVLNSPFPIRWLVWMIGIAFAAVALLSLEWPRAFRSLRSETPTGWLRTALILAIPIAFILDSQICGLGFKACSTLCNVISFTMIGLGTITAVRLYQNKSVGRASGSDGCDWSHSALHLRRAHQHHLAQHVWRLRAHLPGNAAGSDALCSLCPARCPNPSERSPGRDVGGCDHLHCGQQSAGWLSLGGLRRLTEVTSASLTDQVKLG